MHSVSKPQNKFQHFSYLFIRHTLNLRFANLRRAPKGYVPFFASSHFPYISPPRHNGFADTFAFVECDG
jgi:hypothetical protein